MRPCHAPWIVGSIMHAGCCARMHGVCRVCHRWHPTPQSSACAANGLAFGSLCAHKYHSNVFFLLYVSVPCTNYGIFVCYAIAHHGEIVRSISRAHSKPPIGAALFPRNAVMIPPWTIQRLEVKVQNQGMHQVICSLDPDQFGICFQVRSILVCTLAHAFQGNRLCMHRLGFRPWIQKGAGLAAVIACNV